MNVESKEIVWLTEKEAEVAIREYVARRIGRAVRRYAEVTGLDLGGKTNAVSVALVKSTTEVLP